MISKRKGDEKYYLSLGVVAEAPSISPFFLNLKKKKKKKKKKKTSVKKKIKKEKN